MVSIDSCRSSVRKKSVINSSFQRRRLSIDRLEHHSSTKKQQPFIDNVDDASGKKPETDMGGAKDRGEKSLDAECFFVDDVPVRVALESPSCVTTRQGQVSMRIKEELQPGETPTASGEFKMAEALKSTTAFIDRPSGAQGAAAGRYNDDREFEK